MDYAQVYDQVSKLIAKQLNITQDSIKPDATLESLGADSLDRVELVMKIEEDFGIEINDEEAEKLSTVKQAVDYIMHLTAQK